jgi:hypothetical protein
MRSLSCLAEGVGKVAGSRSAGRRQVTTGEDDALFPECARGYIRDAVDSYVERSAFLRDKGFAPAPPEGFPRSQAGQGYDPAAVDRHVGELVRDAAATGLQVLPELVNDKIPYRVNRRERRRPDWRQHERDSEAEWRRVSDLPGTRLTVRARARIADKITGPCGEVLLTRRAGILTLATGQALRIDWPDHQVTDTRTGDPVLWFCGLHFFGHAGGQILFRARRYLMFPVSGTGRRNAVMTAVSESATTMLCFRRIPKGMIEVVVSPDCDLTPEILCAIALTAEWLDSYFDKPSDGALGGG